MRITQDEVDVVPTVCLAPGTSLRSSNTQIWKTGVYPLSSQHASGAPASSAPSKFTSRGLVTSHRARRSGGGAAAQVTRRQQGRVGVKAACHLALVMDGKAHEGPGCV